MAVGKTAVLGASAAAGAIAFVAGFLSGLTGEGVTAGAATTGGGAGPAPQRREPEPGVPAPRRREPEPGVAARRQRARVPGAELPRPRAELLPPRAGSPWFRSCTGYKIAATLRRSTSPPPWRPGIFRCKCGVRREAPRPPEPPRPGSPWRRPCTYYKIAARFHRSTCPPPLRPGIFRCIGGVRLGPRFVRKVRDQTRSTQRRC